MEQRYSRQIIFPRIGLEGQKHLSTGSVIILGAGALGTVSANNLTRAGIGRIKIVDRDLVELNNLQRQILYDEADAQKRLPKAIAAVEKLKKINSSIKLEAEILDIQPHNIERLIDGFDLVLDALDNMETRFLVNDACVKKNIPWIYAAVLGSLGMTMNIMPGKTACLTCMIKELPSPDTMPTCDTAGVVNTIPSIIASIQNTEAIKMLIGSGEISTQLTYIDIWDQSYNRVIQERNPNCPTCGKKKFKFLKEEKVSPTLTLCGRHAVQISPATEIQLSLSNLKQKLEPLGEVFDNGYLVSFKIDDYELVIFPTGRVLVKGTCDEALARTLYSKYIGQ